MFLSNPSFVLAILATSSFVTLSVSADGGTFNYLGGFPATTDVQEIANKDTIQAEFQELLAGKEDGGDTTDLCGNLERGKDFYFDDQGQFLKDLPTYTETNSRMMNMYESYYEKGYATLWVSAALEGGVYQGNNFGEWGDNMLTPCIGQQEAAKKGTAYIAGLLEVNQYMEQASAEIANGCVYQEAGSTCMDAIEAWNKAAAFYVGSMEGTKGEGSGYQIFALGDKRCQNYENCGPNGDSPGGVARTNIVAISLFQKGAGLVFSGDLEGLQKCIKEINDSVLVMLVQGTLRYAHKLGVRGSFLAKELGEGSTFAAALLPQLAAVNTKAAKTIRKEFQIGAKGKTNKKKFSFEKVHLTLACNYFEMGISCAEVGSLIDGLIPAAFEQCDLKIPQKSVCDFSKKKQKKFEKVCKKYMPTEKNANPDAPFERS